MWELGPISQWYWGSLARWVWSSLEVHDMIKSRKKYMLSWVQVNWQRVIEHAWLAAGF